MKTILLVLIMLVAVPARADEANAVLAKARGAWTLGAGRTITVTLTPNSTSDYDLYVYNSNVTQIGSSLNGTGAVDSVSVKNTGTSAFTRYAKVIYYSGATGTAGTYTIKLTF